MIYTGLLANFPGVSAHALLGASSLFVLIADDFMQVLSIFLQLCFKVVSMVRQLAAGFPRDHGPHAGALDRLPRGSRRLRSSVSCALAGSS